MYTPNDGVGQIYNFQIGRCNSIALGLECVFAYNHNTKRVSTGAMEDSWLRCFGKKELPNNKKDLYRVKGNIIIQNDVWIGGNCTIMSGVTIHDGAVVARNSHVVSDVPPYAVVGGNPAKIIGYRFEKDIREKLYVIQWWNWSEDKILENINFFTEDVEGFCDRFYMDAKNEFDGYVSERKINDDAYIMFLDYYNKYPNYPTVIEEFLDRFYDDTNKSLILFIQKDFGVDKLTKVMLENLQCIVDDISKDQNIKCKVELYVGDTEFAKKLFLQCSHYIMLMTSNAVLFNCLADRLDIEVISGVDRKIQFEKKYNIVKQNE